MDKSKLLFNIEYENFYEMAEENDILSKYCEEVFGIDFSQDGYSDLEQTMELIRAADIKPKNRVLDIGCGSGKMAEYIADLTSSKVYGFDYSENAIKDAKARTAGKKNLFFEEGIIGEKQYKKEYFDVIIAVDTMCFALDMEAFVKELYGWLKPGGVFIAFYEEGHIKSISENADNTELAIALIQNEINYETVDYINQHYLLLKRKREVVTRMKDLFMEHNMEFYYKCCIDSSIDLDMSLEEFRKKFNRFMYIARKKTTE